MLFWRQKLSGHGFPLETFYGHFSLIYLCWAFWLGRDLSFSQHLSVCYLEAPSVSNSPGIHRGLYGWFITQTRINPHEIQNGNDCMVSNILCNWQSCNHIPFTSPWKLLFQMAVVTPTWQQRIGWHRILVLLLVHFLCWLALVPWLLAGSRQDNQTGNWPAVVVPVHQSW